MTCKQRPADTVANKQRALPQLFQLFMLSVIILLIGGGVALLWETHYIGRPSMFAHAAGDVSVAGPPTLSAATVDAIFARLGSPMVGTGKLVEQTSRLTNIDDAFALGVWWTETNDGAAGVGRAYRNPGSVRGSVGYPSAFDGYTIYPSYSAAIVYWFHMLRNNYVNRGLSTVYVIARPYVGTSSYPLWAGKVIALMYNYRGMAPPPPAIIPKPKPTVNPSVVAAKNARIQKLIPWLQYLVAHNDAALTLYRGQTQEINYATDIAPQPANKTPTLPFAANLAIVLFGLLTALAIALFAYKLPVESRKEDQPSAQTREHRESVQADIVVPHREDQSAAHKLPIEAPQENHSSAQMTPTDHLPLVRTTPLYAQQSLAETIPLSQQSPDRESVPSTNATNTTPDTNAPFAPRKNSPAPIYSLPTRNPSTDAVSRRVTLLPPKTYTNTSTGSLLHKHNQKDDTNH
jgi:hypothetical protein